MAALCSEHALQGSSMYALQEHDVNRLTRHAVAMKDRFVGVIGQSNIWFLLKSCKAARLQRQELLRRASVHARACDAAISP